MIDVAKARAELAAIDTDDVQIGKLHYAAMLDAVDRGQRAENALINAQSQLNAIVMRARIA